MIGVFQELTVEEIRFAAIRGMDRQIECVTKGFRDRFAPPDPWGNNVYGAVGELAVCKFTGRYWTGVAGYGKAKNDGLGFEVKTTPRDDGRLIVRPYMADDIPFVLATGTISGPRLGLWLRGWILGREGKRDEYLTTTVPPPAYFVPQHKLRPIETLRAFLGRGEAPPARVEILAVEVWDDEP